MDRIRTTSQTPFYTLSEKRHHGGMVDGHLVSVALVTSCGSGIESENMVSRGYREGLRSTRRRDDSVLLLLDADWRFTSGARACQILQWVNKPLLLPAEVWNAVVFLPQVEEEATESLYQLQCALEI